MQHFILDFETIGQDVFTAPIVNCSYYTFDWSRFSSDNPYTFEELVTSIRLDKMQLEPQIKEDGYVYKKRDIDWWMEQGPVARKQIMPSANDIPVSQFVTNIISYLQKTKLKYWWSRSNTFDPILLHRAFRDHATREQLDEVLPYWRVRDIRTYIDTQFNFELKKNGFCPMDDEAEWAKVFTPHNSIHDLAADILRIQRIERAINA